MSHQVFKSPGIRSIEHPFPNLKFEVMFPLYDPTQLFKNIRNNWITEKTQTLDCVEPETNEKSTAKWKDYKNETKSGILKETKIN